MEMKIKKNAWHVHVYKASVKLWCRFTGNKEWEYMDHPNLCTYIRMMTVYAPIIIGLHLAVLLSPFWVSAWVASVYPDSGVAGGFSAVWAVVWRVLAVGVGIIALLFAVFAFDEFIGSGLKKKWKERREQRREAVLLLKTEQEIELSAWQVFAQWAQDRHEKICRQIKFS